MASTLALLRRLVTEKVEFVLVGGMAAIAHGSLTLPDFQVNVVGLEDLITSKRTLGRPKDQRVARELALVLERLQRG